MSSLTESVDGNTEMLGECQNTACFGRASLPLYLEAVLGNEKISLVSS